MNFLEDINLINRQVLVRVDYNVPIERGVVIDDYRITQSLPTINYCLDNNASVVLMSHLGRPNGKKNLDYSLKPIALKLEEVLGRKVHFSEDCISDESFDLSKNMKSNEIHLLENLRFYEEEQADNKSFSKKLSFHGDVYINDAFGTAHRRHASNSNIVNYFRNKGIGRLFQKEYEFLSSSIDDISGNLIVLVGGKKIETKIKFVENLLQSADKILIGGAMAYPLLKEQGCNIGGSFSTPDGEDCAKSIVNTKEFNEKVVLPIDHLVSESIDGINVGSIDIEDTKSSQMGFDIGNKTVKLFNRYIENANTIIWNGPVGMFENKSFSNGTCNVIRSIERATSNGASSIVGGGDSVSAINEFSSIDKFTHVSTGGGASLMLLSGQQLPAIRRIK
tara:strand:+ start:393 stop:1568 length:1176 start_codon:yes stop_codon:yes gene_type:complete